LNLKFETIVKVETGKHIEMYSPIGTSSTSSSTSASGGGLLASSGGGAGGPGLYKLYSQRSNGGTGKWVGIAEQSLAQTGDGDVLSIALVYKQVPFEQLRDGTAVQQARKQATEAGVAPDNKALKRKLDDLTVAMQAVTSNNLGTMSWGSFGKTQRVGAMLKLAKSDPCLRGPLVQSKLFASAFSVGEYVAYMDPKLQSAKALMDSNLENVKKAFSRTDYDTQVATGAKSENRSAFLLASAMIYNPFNLRECTDYRQAPEDSRGRVISFGVKAWVAALGMSKELQYPTAPNQYVDFEKNLRAALKAKREKLTQIRVAVLGGAAATGQMFKNAW